MIYLVTFVLIVSLEDEKGQISCHSLAIALNSLANLCRKPKPFLFQFIVAKFRANRLKVHIPYDGETWIPGDEGGWTPGDEGGWTPGDEGAVRETAVHLTFVID